MFLNGIYRKEKYKRLKFPLVMLLLTATGFSAMAEGAVNVPKPSSINDPVVLTMVIVMLILLLIIGLLAHVLLGAASYYYAQQKEKAQKEKQSGAALPATILVLFALCSSPLFAQNDAMAVTTTVANFGSLSPTAFYFLAGVIVIELLVIFVLLFQLRIFLAKGKAVTEAASAAVTVKKTPSISWWDKLNKFRPVDQEPQIDLGHEYDGIRELDNRLPPWWLYSFYLSMVFAGIYLWQHHVSHSAPDSHEELEIAMKIAAEQQQAYLKKAANSVDENTVQLISDAALLENGQKVFMQNCAACHGKAAEGMVGPNLTDDYWLHGGSIKDIFKTIKYGWPDKGMKSWKEDLSPAQIAQVASYIKHLKGTNPPNAKEKQGELYEEANSGTPKDSVITTAAK